MNVHRVPNYDFGKKHLTHFVRHVRI